MGLFNQNLNKEMWDYTNYENQVKHMENAGLNTGLMYGGAGSGGVASGGGVSGGGAQGADGSAARTAMGLQLAAQMKLLNAQADNLNADTENKRQATELDRKSVV